MLLKRRNVNSFPFFSVFDNVMTLALFDFGILMIAQLDAVELDCGVQIAAGVGGGKNYMRRENVFSEIRRNRARCDWRIGASSRATNYCTRRVFSIDPKHAPRCSTSWTKFKLPGYMPRAGTWTIPIRISPRPRPVCFFSAAGPLDTMTASLTYIHSPP